MKRWHLPRALTKKAFILGLALLALLPASAHALTIKDVRLGSHPDKVRMVLDLSEKTDFRAFTMDSPWRLIIDMPDFIWEAGAIAKPAGSAVRDIRQGSLQPGLSRIVIDLTHPIAIKSVFFLPRDSSGHSSDRLVIDYAPVTETTAMAEKSRIFGRLDAGNLPQSAMNAPMATPARKPAAATVPGATALSQIPVTPPQKPQAITEASALSAASEMVVPDRKPAGTAPGEKPLIMIDAGHGGEDPGAAGANGLSEKQVTLAMARTLKKTLEGTGRYRVKLTRDKDEYLRLHRRVELARTAKADLFISLHADSINKPGVRGASIYTLSEKASDEQSELLAMRENRADLIAGIDLSTEDAMVANILVNLTMRDTMNQSKFFANTVADTFRAEGVRTLDNTHRYAGFAVLKAPDIPSILVEMGFMSNQSEAQLLSSPAFQQKLSKALVSSIDAYFARMRENNRT